VTFGDAVTGNGTLAPAQDRLAPTSAGPRTRTARVLRAVGRRLLAVAGVLLGAATLAFGALQLIPGDPVSVLLGPSTQASPRVRAEITHDYGFDQPLLVQYGHFMGRLARGDLGISYQLQRPVSDLIAEQVRPTVELAAAAIVLAIVLAIVFAVATAGRRSLGRTLAIGWELLAASTPSYWVGLLLLTALSFQAHIFPVSGDDGLRALVLPGLTLALPLAGVLGQVLREGLDAALAQPHVVSAQARGTGVVALRLRHALRHATLPLVTLAGWLIGALLGGAVVVETVFGRPGIGALALSAVSSRDMPVVTGVVLLSATVFVTISTVVDLLYPVLDPRLRKV